MDMKDNINNHLVIGISSRALFDLDKENGIYETDGLKAFSNYQIEHEKDVLKPGPGFPLVKALLKLNEPSERRTEVIIMSRNHPGVCLRIFNSIEHYGLDISRAVLTGGEDVAKYLGAFKTDLFLSGYKQDVQNAIKAHIAAGLIYINKNVPQPDPNLNLGQIRLAFDADAVIFSDEAEKIYKEKGLSAFLAHERENAAKPLPEGPFSRLLKTLSSMQTLHEPAPFHIAIATARNVPALKRVILTLREWNVNIDEAFFLGNMEKKDVLKAFDAHIFFDDKLANVISASDNVTSFNVPVETT